MTESVKLQIENASTEMTFTTQRSMFIGDIENKPNENIPENQKQHLNLKDGIKFTYSSFKRRNIDKALVRALSSARKDARIGIFEDYRIHNIDKMKYYEIAITLDKLNDQVKKNESKKDYVSILNWMMSDLAHRIVLKNCLKTKKEMIKESTSKRLKGENQRLYMTTLDDYLNYIDSL